MSEWIFAFKKIVPIYLLVHVAFALLTLFSALFTLADFGTNAFPVNALISVWNRWDTGNYTTIATRGYSWHISLAAFFPLFILLERAGSYLMHSPFVAGLAISNLANLGVLIVFYEIIKEDFDEQRADRSVLYLSIFPSAFFFAAAYTESLFLLLALLSFHQIRRGNFWLAGLFGFFACLTRSSGIFLLFPMVYALWQKRQLCQDVLALALPLLGIGAYSWYCYAHFGDILAWEHAQRFWHRQLMPPWQTIWITLQAIKRSPGLLSFQALHNLLDFAQIFFAISMLVIGMRRMPKIYIAYSVPFLFFLLSVPSIGNPLIPMQSMPRFILEVFPVFVVAGALSKQRWFHDGYLLLSGMLLCLSCLLFLMGHWMV